MCKMLLSINPEHVENILNGTKQVEFRKVRCRNEVDKIIIYSTSPVMRVVAEVELVGIIEDDTETVWELTKEVAGISKNFFESYYKGKDKAVAYQLGRITKYKQPRELIDFGIKAAPQSFAYIA